MSTLSNPGGQALFNEYELVTADKLNQVGSIAEQTVLHLLAQLFWNAGTAAEQSGFASHHLEASQGVGVLEVTIGSGVGFFYDSTVSGAYDPAYKPICLPTPTTVTLDAHHATLPRIDLICVAPDTADDEIGTRTLWDVSAEAPSTGTVPNRRVFYAAIQTVKGTAASSPSCPALPSGYLELARVTIPASTGAVTIQDTRPRVQWAAGWSQGPERGYAAGHVLTDDMARYEGELEVTAPGGLFVAVAAGEAWSDGVRFSSTVATTLACVPDATHPRIATVYIGPQGVGIQHGTPAALPSAPTLLGSRMALANVRINAAVTSINSGNITDRRVVGQPYGGDQLRDDAVSEAKIADDAVTEAKILDGSVSEAKIADDAVSEAKILDGSVSEAKIADDAVTETKILDGSVSYAKLGFDLPVYAQSSVGAWSGGTCDVTIQAKNADLSNCSEYVSFMVTVCYSNGAPVEPTSTLEYDVQVIVGTHQTPTGVSSGSSPHGLRVRTTSAGAATVRITDTGSVNTGTWLRIEPTDRLGWTRYADVPSH